MVTGGDPVESRGDGVFLDHDERYEATREFLHIWTRLLAGETVNYHGKHHAVEDARQLVPAGAEALSAALLRRIVRPWRTIWPPRRSTRT